MCAVRCDRVVYPSGCLAAECPRLYSYEQDGRMLIGCLERVFNVELDLEAFRELEATRRGFGALRAVRAPLPVCMTQVDSAFPHRLPGACVNPRMGAMVSVGTGDDRAREGVDASRRAG